MQLALTTSSPNEEAKKRLTRKITLGPVQFPTVGNFYYCLGNPTPSLAAGKVHIIRIDNVWTCGLWTPTESTLAKYGEPGLMTPMTT